MFRKRLWIKLNVYWSDFSALNTYVDCVESFTDWACGQQAAFWYGEYVKRIMWVKEGYITDDFSWGYLNDSSLEIDPST